MTNKLTSANFTTCNQGSGILFSAKLAFAPWIGTKSSFWKKSLILHERVGHREALFSSWQWILLANLDSGRLGDNQIWAKLIRLEVVPSSLDEKEMAPCRGKVCARNWLRERLNILNPWQCHPERPREITGSKRKRKSMKVPSGLCLTLSRFSLLEEPTFHPI